MSRAIIPLALFLALAGLFWYVLGQMNQGEYNPREVPTQFIGKPAPAFSLPDLLDPTSKVSSGDMAGKPWLLNVWGTWCPECWKEHDYLLHLARRKGIPIIGINWRDEAAEAKLEGRAAAGRPAGGVDRLEVDAGHHEAGFQAHHVQRLGADGPDAEVPAGVPQTVPQGHRPVRRHPQLVAEIAGESGARDREARFRRRHVERLQPGELAEAGGHVGFIEGGTPWRPEYYLPRRLLGFLDNNL